MPWSRAFDDPIPHPDGGTIRTLEQAARYIVAGLSKQEAATDRWQLAMQCLIDAAEGRSFLMFADIAMRRALNHGKPVPAPEPPRAKKMRILR